MHFSCQIFFLEYVLLLPKKNLIKTDIRLAENERGGVHTHITVQGIPLAHGTCAIGNWSQLSTSPLKSHIVPVHYKKK